MIAAISIALGLIAMQLRSALAYALLSFAIFVSFAAASVLSSGDTRWLLLGESVLCFNLGIGLYLMVMTTVEALRRQSRHG